MDEQELNYFETDMVKAYIQEIKKNPILSTDEQKELARKYKNGDLEAKQTLINSNLLYVVSIAYKFKERLKSLDILDVIQEGNLGLMRAIETYDPEQSAFTTYAHDWIYQYIDRSIKDKNQEIRTPVHFQEIKTKYLKMLNKYESKNIPLPKDEEICNLLNITMDTLSLIKESNIFNADSLNRTIGDEENSELLNFISYQDTETEQVEKKIDNHLLLLSLKKSLSPIHYYVLYKTILFENKITLRNLGKMFDVSPERIRQVQTIALQKAKKIILNQKKDNLDKKTKQNIEPIEPNDLIRYVYLRDGLSDIEVKLLYLKLIDKNQYSLEEYSSILNCTKEEYKKLISQLKKIIATKMQDKHKFIRFKNNLLRTYGLRIYDLLHTKTEIIDFYSVKEHFDNYTYDDLLEQFNTYMYTLTLKEEALLKDYFEKTPKCYTTKNYIERKINFALKPKQKRTTNLPNKILYKTLQENIDRFTEEQILYLECYYFKNKDKSLFKSKYPNSNNRNITTLIHRLESIYFNLSRLLENNFNKEKYESIRDKLDENQQKYLDLFYGFQTTQLTITEISIKLNEDYIKTHDKLRDARNCAINLYCNRSGKKQIEKENYIPYIQNLAYGFKEETRNILKMFLIDNMTYDEIASITNLSNYRISNIITDSIRKLDFYRYNISEIFIIEEKDFYEFIKYHKKYSNEEIEILKLRFLEYQDIDSIVIKTNLSKKEINILIGNFFKLYNKYLVKDIELTKKDYLKVFNTHYTESILTEEEKEIVALYSGIKSKYNPNELKLTANEIAHLKNKTKNVIYHTALRCLDRIKLQKLNKYHRDLCYINRDELDKLLDDPFLPISDKERTIICHLFALKKYQYKNLEEIGKIFSLTESSTRRRYQRAILNILQYKNNEIEGIITYESIIPNLRYFSNSDKIFIEEYYKNNLTYEEISKKYKLSRDKVIIIFNRIKTFLYELIKNKKVKKFDFDYYEQIKRKPDLPFYGDIEEAIKIFDLYFGQTNIERKSVPEIIKELKLNINSTAVNLLISTLLTSVEKYKIGIRKEQSYTYNDVLDYFNRHNNEMSAYQLSIYKKYFNKMKNKKFRNSKYQYPPEEILFDLIKEKEGYLDIDTLSKEQITKILKNPKIKLSKNLRKSIMSYFDIQPKDLMSGKDKNKIYRILYKLENIKECEKNNTLTKKNN